MEKNLLNQFFIYQLNTRIFCAEKKSLLRRIPDSIFEEPEFKTADAVWLMGIWKASPKSIEICKIHEGLSKEFQKALPDLKEEDIIGSPYSIFEYIPNLLIANHKYEIKQFKFKLNVLGKKLILDFVPNHVSVDSIYIDLFPDYFLEKKGDVCKNSFKHKNGKIYYYGRDPFFDGWSDTVQWDFSNPNVISLHKKILSDISEIADGVRCDMAMLPLVDVFEKTHGLASLPYWSEIIPNIKKQNPEFLFIAEVYWNREFELQEMGFDYTYDKTLYDRLKKSDPKEIYLHLLAEKEYQKKSLRFIENHDEERALSYFGKNSISYFALICFLDGAILYHEGQSHGAELKTPVQIARRKNELHEEVYSFYNRAFIQIQNRKDESIELLDFNLKSYPNENVEFVILKFLITEKFLEILILNTYNEKIYGKLNLPSEIEKHISNLKNDLIEFTDILDNQNYKRTKKDFFEGIHIELDSGKSHWFVISK